MVFELFQKAWPQIAGRDLPILSPQTANFLPKICRQTKGNLQTTEIQRITKIV